MTVPYISASCTKWFTYFHRMICIKRIPVTAGGAYDAPPDTLVVSVFYRLLVKIIPELSTTRDTRSRS